MNDIPMCCGQLMLVQAGGVFECDGCGERLTVNDVENRREDAGLRFQQGGFDREQDKLEAFARRQERGEL